MAAFFKCEETTKLQRRIVPYIDGVVVMLSGQRSYPDIVKGKAKVKSDLKGGPLGSCISILTQVILKIPFVWRDLTPRCKWYEQALGIFTGTMLITLLS